MNTRVSLLRSAPGKWQTVDLRSGTSGRRHGDLRRSGATTLFSEPIN